MNRYPEPPPPLTPQNLSPQFLFFRDGRRDLRHTANPLGFMLLLIAISFTFLPQAFSSLLSFIGYRGSLAYRNFGNIEPTVYYLIQGCQFALSILVPCLLYLLIYRPAPAKIIPSQRVNPLVFLSLTFIGLGLSLFLTCLPRHLWSVFLTYSLGTLLPIKWQPPPCRLWPLGCF